MTAHLFIAPFEESEHAVGLGLLALQVSRWNNIVKISLG